MGKVIHAQWRFRDPHSANKTPKRETVPVLPCWTGIQVENYKHELASQYWKQNSVEIKLIILFLVVSLSFIGIPFLINNMWLIAKCILWLSGSTMLIFPVMTTCWQIYALYPQWKEYEVCIGRNSCTFQAPGTIVRYVIPQDICDLIYQMLLLCGRLVDFEVLRYGEHWILREDDSPEYQKRYIAVWSAKSSCFINPSDYD